VVLRRLPALAAAADPARAKDAGAKAAAAAD